MNLSDVLYNLVGFTAVAIIFLILLTIILKFLSKQFSVDKIKLYGIFLNMNNNTILSFSLISINYLFLVWCLINFQMNYIYLIFSFVLILLSGLFAKNYKKIPLNIINLFVECASIYVVAILKDYIFKDGFNTLLFIVLVLVVIFIFLYFTYTMFRSLNSIVKLQKDLSLSKKKVKDEN